MIMNAQVSLLEICGDAKAQGSSEISAPGALYAVDFRRTGEKIRPELLPPAAADCAWGVRLMETRSRSEDDKLSIEPGHLQAPPISAARSVNRSAYRPCAIS
jgi:hypothetical protein